MRTYVIEVHVDVDDDDGRSEDDVRKQMWHMLVDRESGPFPGAIVSIPSVVMSTTDGAA